MDHSYGMGRMTEPTPAEISVGAGIVSFLHGGGRLVVVAGPTGAGTAGLLDLVLAGMPARVLRVRNRLPGPLDLAGILSQIDPATNADAHADEAGALLRCLTDRAHDAGPAVLAVDDAHTLTPRALAALARVPGLGGPDLPGAILLLAGEGALLDKLSARGLERMRDPATALTVRLAGLAQAEADAPAPRSLRPWLMGGAAAILAAGVLLRPDAGPAPELPAGGAPVQRVASAQEDPTLARAAPARAAPVEVTAPLVPPPVLDAPDVLHAEPGAGVVAPDAAIRRGFDAFLDRAGPDTALLTGEAREGLYREYLSWRARSPVARTGGPSP